LGCGRNSRTALPNAWAAFDHHHTPTSAFILHTATCCWLPVKCVGVTRTHNLAHPKHHKTVITL
jgi:hypothetical protein